jgi:hypothetical protein
LRRSGETQALQGAFHALAQKGAAEAVQMALSAQVFVHGESFVETLRLEDHAHVAAHGGGVALHVVARDDGVALGGHHHGGEDAEEGRFAAAVGTKQAEDLAFFHFETDARESDAVTVSMGKILNLDHRPGLSRSIRP